MIPLNTDGAVHVIVIVCVVAAPIGLKNWGEVEAEREGERERINTNKYLFLLSFNVLITSEPLSGPNPISVPAATVKVYNVNISRPGMILSVALELIVTLGHCEGSWVGNLVYLIRYWVMIPFLYNTSGCCHDKDTDVEVPDTAVTPSGDWSGPVQVIIASKLII